MSTPSKADLTKKGQDLDKLLKKLSNQETGEQKIPSLVTLVRSAIRASWAVCPVKLAYYEMGRVPDTSSELRKWKMQCECCGEWFKCDQIEIDHREGNHTFTKPEDFGDYFNNILDVQFKDLQRICKFKCHRIKSHLEKQNFPDMYSACVDKLVIFFVKYVTTEDFTLLLERLEIVPATNAKKRRQQFSEWLLSLDIEEVKLMHFFESCDHIMRLDAKYKKAKKFRLSAADRGMITRYKCFWRQQVSHPSLTLSIMSNKEVVQL